MFKKVIVFFAFVVFLNAQNVAYKSYKLFSQKRDDYINTMLFYPSLEKENFILDKHKLFISENISLNGKITKDKSPLIILSHGGLRSAPNQINWLAKSLAKEGFIVLITKSDFNKKLALYEPWLRANDTFISLLDLKENSIKENIDFDKIYSVGFLFGATSTLLINSVKIDLNLYKNICKENQSIDCKWYEENGINPNEFDFKFISNLEYTIPLKKAILFDMELPLIFDKNRLINKNKELFFINLSEMKLLDNSNFKTMYKYIKIEDANLFSSFSLCTKKGELTLKGTQENKDLCSQNNENKNIIHEKILNLIIEYFES